MEQNEMKKKILKSNLEPLEKQIMEKANFLYICKYHGTEHQRACIREALNDITQLTESQFCSVFSIYKNDIEAYIDKIYNTMQEMGAE